MSKAQITGNIGMYYAAYRLSREGWNVMPTARNARGIDLLAYDTDATEFLSIQVKALSKRSAVPLGTDLRKIMGDWWIIVIRTSTPSPVSYVLEPGEVRALASQSEKNGTVSYWLEPKHYDDQSFREAWHRLGPEGRVGDPSGY